MKRRRKSKRTSERRRRRVTGSCWPIMCRKKTWRFGFIIYDRANSIIILIRHFCQNCVDILKKKKKRFERRSYKFCLQAEEAEGEENEQGKLREKAAAAQRQVSLMNFETIHIK